MTITNYYRRFIACALALAIWSEHDAPLLAAAGGAAYVRGELHAAYARELTSLADSCAADDLPRQAELTRHWLPQPEAETTVVYSLPRDFNPPEMLAADAAGKAWWEKFVALRTAQAEKLFVLAEAAIKEKQPGLAYELARAAVRENPDHERGRAILGYEKYRDHWVLPETARRLKTGQVWHEKFGWLPAEQVSRYEKGMRNYRGNWIDAAEDARLHSNIRNGWRVDSEHFSVLTNRSLEAGVQLLARLETLYEAWRQAFVTYYATPAEIERWFAAGARPRSGTPRKLHQVVYFADKSQYVEALRPAQPRIDMTLGIYFDSAKTAYFFAGDEQYEGTLNHEATHQLFRESRPSAIDPGRKNNFWVVEAIACYMESLAEKSPLAGSDYGKYFTLGGVNAGRVPAARQRLLDDQFYVPLDELTAYGMEALQRDARLPQIYSQSSGLALFLMHGEAGKLRQSLVDYLLAVYSGKVDPTTLEKTTGAKYEELDRRYREFMR